MLLVLLLFFGWFSCLLLCLKLWLRSLVWIVGVAGVLFVAVGIGVAGVLVVFVLVLSLSIVVVFGVVDVGVVVVGVGSGVLSTFFCGCFL